MGDLRHYIVSRIRDEGPVTFARFMDWCLYHPDYGYGDVVTVTPFFIATGDTFPSSGQLVVTGAANSKARLTALSSTQFQVEVDADGDDIYETTVGPVDWTSL